MPGISLRRRSICHVVTTFNQRSGCARRTVSILEACVAAELQVSLVVGRDHDLPDWGLPGVSVTVLDTLRKPLAPGRDLSALRSLGKLLRELKPDLVHTHLAKAGILGRTAAARSRVPRIVHTVHGPTFPEHLPGAKRRLFLSLEQRAAGVTDAMVYVGSELRSSYVEAGVGTWASSQVIRTGLHKDLQQLLPEQARELRLSLTGGAASDLVLVHVGRLVPSKRPEHAIEVLKELVARGIDAHLVMVGEALVAEEKGFSQRLRGRIHKSSLAERVHFTGFRDDVLQILQCSDAVLLTSTHEGLPNVAVEAALVCTPVVTYPVTGVREVVEHERTGWITAGHEPRHMVLGVLTVRDNVASMRPHLMERSRKISALYDQEEMVKATLAIYENLLR